MAHLLLRSRISCKFGHLKFFLEWPIGFGFRLLARLVYHCVELMNKTLLGRQKRSTIRTALNLLPKVCTAGQLPWGGRGEGGLDPQCCCDCCHHHNTCCHSHCMCAQCPLTQLSALYSSNSIRPATLRSPDAEDLVLLNQVAPSDDCCCFPTASICTVEGPGLVPRNQACSHGSRGPQCSTDPPDPPARHESTPCARPRTP